MTPPIVAVVGGGQLARMMCAPATALGVELRVLVESETASAAGPAHSVVVGMPADTDAVAAVMAGAAVVTWEHEHIPPSVFEAAAGAGVPALPGPRALTHARDKIAMRELMDRLGLPNPAWRAVATADDVAGFLAQHGPSVLKTASGGYDGKGVRMVADAAGAADWLGAAAAGGPAVLIEARVPFTRELAAQVARRPSGQVAAYPVVESVQRDGVCAEVTSPAPGLSPALADQAREIATRIAIELDVVGMLAVELFEVDGALVINELAMRPHNSGHWTIDGAVTSQFEQHLRAVLDLPLGATDATAPWAVMVNVLGGAREDLPAALADIDDAGVKVQLYGKEVRAGRKVGHVTVVGSDLEQVRARARRAAAIVGEGGAQ